MHVLGHLTVAASVAITSFALPSVSFAMECYELCFGFYPPTSLVSGGGSQDDQCDRRVRDSGGSCTINGKMNLGLDVPRRKDHRRENPRRYDWDVH
jgi:hypothetical protein